MRAVGGGVDLFVFLMALDRWKPCSKVYDVREVRCCNESKQVDDGAWSFGPFQQVTEI